jgi:pimeloyl-ACP methyl ester carboxylesterase
MQYLFLLHGAIGAKDQLQPLATALQHKYIVHTLNFSGHGGDAFPAEPFSIQFFANDVLNYMQQHQIDQANIFGYSMGGYVAMYLAKQHPKKINKVITLATKFHWDESTAAKEIKMLDASTIEQKIPAFANQLQQRHAPQNWKLLLEKTAALLLSLGKNNPLLLEDYEGIGTASLLLLGDRDKMITLEETLAVYKQLPNAQLAILPNTAHPIEKVNIDTLVFFIQQFIGAE